MKTIRTFIAVKTSPAVRQRAGKLIQEFRTAGADVKWVDPKNLHVTLKVLGDVDAREIHRVCKTVEGAVTGVGPFELEMRGAGAFPNAGRPRTVWLGAGSGQDEMAALNERIEAAVEELGFRREARRFQVHLTIGRIRRGGPGVAELGQLIQKHAEFEAGRTRVDEVIVFSSHLAPSGPTYEALARVPLP